MDQEALVEYIGSAELLEASKNATRLVAKLKSAVQSRELYETHQILRTINFRFITTREKLRALQNLLFLGSSFLLEHKEYVSGQDIAVLFLEASAKRLQHYQEENRDGDAKLQLTNPSTVFHSDRQTPAYEICRKTAHLTVRLPDTEIGQQKFVADTLKILTTKILNRSLLHNVVAEAFWQSKDYVNARYHYLHCASLENAQDVAKLLVEYQTSCASKCEIDLFITQFTFQFLCLQCPIDSPKASNQKTNTGPSSSSTYPKTRSTIKSIAERVFSNYAINHPLLSQVDIPFSSLPLLNFTHFIISILDGNNESETFEMLRDIYKVTWSRDPNYQGYLMRIGTLYFGIVDPAKQRQNSGGLFNNLLQSLLDGNDDDDEEPNQEGTSGTNNNNNNSSINAGYSSSDDLD